MPIITTKLPCDSLLNKNVTIYDYVDSFQGTFISEQDNLKSIEIAKAFFTSAPKWVHKLFTFRNKVVGLFGLKTSGHIIERQHALDKFKCEPGDQVGLFRVIDKTDKEVILGEDDKHLNFRISLFLHNQIDYKYKNVLTISTTVIFNNRFGKLYFLPVRLFHKIIVPAMLRSMIKQFELKKIS